MIFTGNIFLSICFVYMWIDSDYLLPTSIGVLFCLLFFPMGLIFGIKWLPFQLIIIAFSMLYFNSWKNPLSFILILYVVLHFPKYKWILFIAYVTAVLVCLGIANRNYAHLGMHSVICLGCYFIIVPLSCVEKKIYLTEDEKRILIQLAEGKEYKNIEGYCQNTIYTKMREAKKRNNLKFNHELKDIFTKSNTKVIIVEK